MTSALRKVVNCTAIFHVIAAFQDGLPQDLVALRRLRKPCQPLAAIDNESKFHCHVEYNHSILKSFANVCNDDRIRLALKYFPRLRDVMIVDAVAHGNFKLLEWIHELFDLNTCHYRLLDLASRYGQFLVLKYLDSLGHIGISKMALDAAAKYGHEDIVTWLLQHKEDGGTSQVLHLAIQNGHVAIAKLLQESDECKIERDIYVIMMQAAARGHRDVIYWYCEHYKHLVGVNYDLYIAFVENDLLAIEKLTTPEHFETSFNLAVQCGKIEIIEKHHKLCNEYIARGYDKFYNKDFNNVMRLDFASTALVGAVENGHLTTIQFFQRKHNPG